MMDYFGKGLWRGNAFLWAAIISQEPLGDVPVSAELWVWRFVCAVVIWVSATVGWRENP